MCVLVAKEAKRRKHMTRERYLLTPYAFSCAHSHSIYRDQEKVKCRIIAWAHKMSTPNCGTTLIRTTGIKPFDQRHCPCYFIACKRVVPVVLAPWIALIEQSTFNETHCCLVLLPKTKLPYPFLRPLIQFPSGQGRSKPTHTTNAETMFTLHPLPVRLSRVQKVEGSNVPWRKLWITHTRSGMTSRKFYYATLHYSYYATQFPHFNIVLQQSAVRQKRCLVISICTFRQAYEWVEMQGVRGTRAIYNLSGGPTKPLLCLSFEQFFETSCVDLK